MRTFLAAVAALAVSLMAAAGCTRIVVDETGCPEVEPKPGVACPGATSLCPYAEGPCQVSFECGAQGWQIADSTCTPAAVDCWAASEGDVCANVGDGCGEGDGPCGSGFSNACGADHLWHTSNPGTDCCPGWNGCAATAPSEGAPCNPCMDSPSCGYDFGCGPGSATAVCGPDAVWHVDPGECPPPAMEPCYLFDEATCATASYCRWLVPGCVTPVVPMAGCYPVDDCTPTSCYAGETCQTLNADPCYNKGCNACAALVSICAP